MHMFLCTHFGNQRLAFSNRIKDIEKLNEKCFLITNYLNFGDEKLSGTDKESILEVTI